MDGDAKASKVAYQYMSKTHFLLSSASLAPQYNKVQYDFYTKRSRVMHSPLVFLNHCHHLCR